MESVSATSCAIGVLVADTNQMQCHLLASALRRRPEFHVTSCDFDAEAILRGMTASPIQVAVLNSDHRSQHSPDLAIVRRLHLAHPEIAKILLLAGHDREVVVNAFRAGVKGLFPADHPFRLLCKCILSVHQGQVWANSEQLQYVIEGLVDLPPLRVVNAVGIKLLTIREEQVVALVVDGLSNRGVARELNLTENTVKKYVFRIFEKLGISSRVELVLYAVSRGGNRSAVAELGLPAGSSKQSVGLSRL